MSDITVLAMVFRESELMHHLSFFATRDDVLLIRDEV